MEQIVFYVLLTLAIIATTVAVAGWVFPLLQSARDVDPSWQMIDISGVVNFRDRIVPVELEGLITSNCTNEAIVVKLWYLFPQEPGRLLNVSANGAQIEATFEHIYGDAVGSHIYYSYLYQLKAVTAIFTNITNIKSNMPIYGSPAILRVVNARSIVIAPQCPGCSYCTFTLEIPYGNRTITAASLVGNYIEIYARDVELK